MARPNISPPTKNPIPSIKLPVFRSLHESKAPNNSSTTKLHCKRGLAYETAILALRACAATANNPSAALCTGSILVGTTGSTFSQRT
ncbi:hypothetical protein LSM04_008711 [Trypanosoma melophagium]|uniref:uncharacterized protein n=1 Tax=Trypanosoma melophagium TaxID=715481 RepID=UPI00351A6D68|nr:hypothetical protein LSM04_008711 [Trypanosoma melophagium]